MKVSVIIPTHNRKELLGHCLEHLFQQDFPKDEYEIILLDDASGDGTQEMVSGLSPACQFHYFREERRIGQPKIRNKGIRYSKGEIVIFVDSDVMVRKDFVAQHVKTHSNFGKAIVLGKLINVARIDDVEKKKPGIFDISLSYFDTANVSVKKKYLIISKGFDEDLLYYGWSDLELGYRLKKMGLRVIRNKNAVGYHVWPKRDVTELKDLLEKERMRGVSGALFYKKHPHFSIKLATRFNPLFFISGPPIHLGRWLDGIMGQNLLKWCKKKSYLLFSAGVKLLLCHYFLKGYQEEMKKG